MPRAEMLQSADRISKLADGQFVFRCQRRPHGQITSTHGSKGDAQIARAQHDLDWHAGSLPEHVKTRLREEVTLSGAIDDFLNYFSALVALRKKSDSTLKDYTDRASRLLAGFPSAMRLESISPAAVQTYVVRRLTTGTKRSTDGAEVRTRGDRVLKELKFLVMLGERNRIRFDWDIDRVMSDVQPEERERHRYSREEVQAFIANLDPLAADYVTVKLYTGLRDSELIALNVGDVDLRSRRITYLCRKRRPWTRLQAVVPDELVPVLERCMSTRHRKRKHGEEWPVRKMPDAPLFDMWGRRLQNTSLRKRFISASAAAKIDPPIESVSIIRHVIFTELLTEKASVRDVAKFAGHTTTKMIEQHYDLDEAAVEIKTEMAQRLVAMFPLTTEKTDSGH